jgi:hypothetical protein
VREVWERNCNEGELEGALMRFAGWSLSIKPKDDILDKVNFGKKQSFKGQVRHLNKSKIKYLPPTLVGMPSGVVHKAVQLA